MTQIRHINVAKHDAQQRRFALNEEHAGCLTVIETARLARVTSKAVLYHVWKDKVGHKFGDGHTSPIHLTVPEIKSMFPQLRPGPAGRPRKNQALSVEEAAELLGGDTIRPDTPEWDEARARIARREP